MGKKSSPRSAGTGRTGAGGPLPIGEIIERLQLDRRPANTPAAAPSRSGRVVTGRLKAHGHANYQFEPHGSPSYYVQIVSSRGVETLWGVDLGRALSKAKTQPKIGTMIGAQRLGSKPVTIPPREGETKTAQQRTFRRAHWIVEDVTFFADSIRRARRDREARLADSHAMRERPELRSAFISLRIAEQFAEAQIRDARDRALFVERVKAVMALSANTSAPVKPAASRAREDPTR